MLHEQWEELRLTGSTDDERLWELFHENSKLGLFGVLPPDAEVEAMMQAIRPVFVFEGYPVVALPPAPPLPLSLDVAIRSRVSARALQPCTIDLEQLAALLFYTYGVTRDNTGTHYSRDFRVVPSGGALYPLELFFYSRSVSGLLPGVYHYNPIENHLRFLREGDFSDELEGSVAQADIVAAATVVFFVSAFFERTTFKYGDRGYRFALIEAGHVGQNLNLVANGLGLGCLNLGGFFDAKVDDFLGLDGTNHSTLYLLAVGGRTQSA